MIDLIIETPIWQRRKQLLFALCKCCEAGELPILWKGRNGVGNSRPWRFTVPSQAGQLGPVLDLEHLENLADMSLDRHFAETQLVGDFAIFVPQGDELDNSHVLSAQALDAVSLGQCLALFDEYFKIFLVDPDIATVNHFQGLAEVRQISILRDNAADVMAQKKTCQVGFFEPRVDENELGFGMCIDQVTNVSLGIEEDDICCKGRSVFMNIVEN